MPSQMEANGFTIYDQPPGSNGSVYVINRAIRCLLLFKTTGSTFSLFRPTYISLETDYKRFSQNHSWLTVLPPYSPMAYRTSYSQLRFSWLRPTQSGHLSGFTLSTAVLATCHRLTTADPSSIQSSRANFLPLRPCFKKPIHKTFTDKYQFPWFVCLSAVKSCLFFQHNSSIASKHLPIITHLFEGEKSRSPPRAATCVSWSFLA